jgi:predicted SAM-dependent methyltransferase
MIKINFGCGDKILDGWINCDYKSYDERVKIVDLNNLPLDFPSNYADEILCDQVLEHILQPFEVVQEFTRILKKGGKLHIGLPLDCNCLSHLRSIHGRSYLQGLYKFHYGNTQYWKKDYDLIITYCKIRKPIIKICLTWYKKIRDFIDRQFFTERHWVMKKK